MKKEMIILVSALPLCTSTIGNVGDERRSKDNIIDYTYVALFSFTYC